MMRPTDLKPGRAEVKVSREVIIVQEEGAVATLLLNRPSALNAINAELLLALREALEGLGKRPEIRVVIITGAGEKAFSAGSDLRERLTLSPDQVKEFILSMRKTFVAIEELNKPVIAAINGLAVGGGAEMSLACDLRVLSETAKMGFPETKLAIIPGGGGTQRLPRLVGKGKAKELIFTGRRISAQEALQIGLANKVCAPAELMEECRALAALICEAGPLALGLAKEAINLGLETDLNTGLSIENNAYWATLPTEDRTEGLVAFQEKRKPVYKGR